MIDWLEIKQFVIAEHIEIEFDSNFTTVTGETGSGKSLIVDAIGILLGHRSDSSYIRHNSDTAELQASFALSPSHPAISWMEQQGMANDSECILRRVFRRNKSSKSYINGHAATVSQLREIGKDLIDIHGQNEHHSLLRKHVQQSLLDSAGGSINLVIELGECYQTLTNIQQQIDDLNDRSHATQERADLLKFQIEELNELSPEPDEWFVLENSHKRLNHQQELVSGTRDIAEMLYESDQDSVSSQLTQCSQQLKQLAEFDGELTPLVKMVEEAEINIEEAANQLRRFYENSNIDPLEIEKIETRFSLYHSLARKHRLLPQLLSDHLDSMKQELAGLKNPKREMKRLKDWFEAESGKYREIANEITAKRKKSAKALARKVTALMQELGMKGGRFDISLAPVTTEAFNRFGNETVEFVVTANPGQPLRPLAKVASGGELSRISLGIQVALADKSRVPTLIFDEVDVGIGGEVANVVGQKLRDLGKSNQVICITHLSQVAVRGDHHFCVSKHGEEQVDASVVKLGSRQRIEEIARMTGGSKITRESLAHAEEMLKSA
jgi:DNA repair protein RecN (Recombination protein N)